MGGMGSEEDVGAGYRGMKQGNSSNNWYELLPFVSRYYI